MSDIIYSDRVGVSECEARYDDALKLIGKQDEQGRTIAIGYFTWSGLQMAPIILRSLFFLVLLFMPIIRQPFGFLSPGSFFGLGQFLREMAFFGWGTWILAVLIYAVYYAVSLLKSSIYTGLPGSEIHFARHKKIINTLKPGSYMLNFDFRIKPYAVVSTKPIAVEMPPVEGNTRDNISLTFRGALILRVADTYKLLVEGGLEKFIRQLKRSYESILKDEIIAVEAKDFNRFLIEEVSSAHQRQEDVSKKLEMLGKTDLTIEFLNQLTEIDEVDVSSFELSESPNPQRRSILDGLKQLADNYGIELIDHLPLGNTTNEDYLKSLALPLANSITRLEQSTDTLKEITEEEISEEISANVADKEIGVLEIRKIIKEIESITATLRDPANEEAIVNAKSIAMENVQQTILGPKISEIEALIAQVQAKVIDTAGLERYMSEVEAFLSWVESQMDQLVPQIDQVMVSKFDAAEMLPEIDVLQTMLDTSGTTEAFAKLRKQAESHSDYSSVDAEIQSLETRANGINVEASIQQVQNALDTVTSDSGISTEAYSPENTSRKIDEIARKADLDVVGAE